MTLPLRGTDPVTAQVADRSSAVIKIQVLGKFDALARDCFPLPVPFLTPHRVRPDGHPVDRQRDYLRTVAVADDLHVPHLDAGRREAGAVFWPDPPESSHPAREEVDCGTVRGVPATVRRLGDSPPAMSVDWTETNSTPWRLTLSQSSTAQPLVLTPKDLLAFAGSVTPGS